MGGLDAIPSRPIRLPTSPSNPPDGTVPSGGMSRLELIDEVLGDLDRDYVGLVDVKRRVRELASLFEVDRLRSRAGVTGAPPGLHMCFTGNPGTGKTMIAGAMGRILHSLGYLERGHVVRASRENLIGQHVGHTAPRAQAVVQSAIGGVLFIDEAYAIHREGSERDFGHEVIEVLLAAMETHLANLAVILAGYPDRMSAFFQHNPGMASRVAHHIHFPDYDLDELMQINALILDERSYRLAPEAALAARRYLADAATRPGFGNGRTVRNMIDLARLRHAHRVLRIAAPSRTELITLEVDDIPAAPGAAAPQPGGTRSGGPRSAGPQPGGDQTPE